MVQLHCIGTKLCEEHYPFKRDMQTTNKSVINHLPSISYFKGMHKVLLMTQTVCYTNYQNLILPSLNRSISFPDSKTSKAFGHWATWTSSVSGSILEISTTAQRYRFTKTWLQHHHVKLLSTGRKLLVPTVDWNYTPRTLLKSKTEYLKVKSILCKIIIQGFQWFICTTNSQKITSRITRLIDS